MRMVGEPVVSKPGFPIGRLFLLGTLFDAMPVLIGGDGDPRVGLGCPGGWYVTTRVGGGAVFFSSVRALLINSC